MPDFQGNPGRVIVVCTLNFTHRKVRRTSWDDPCGSPGSGRVVAVRADTGPGDWSSPGLLCTLEAERRGITCRVILAVSKAPASTKCSRGSPIDPMVES